jgi:uridylate kinase
MAYKRILLKLSGEVLMGGAGFGIDPATVGEIIAEIAEVKALGTDIGIVIGGGNIYRGMRAEGQGIDRVTGDYMGMIATVMNALTLQSFLEKTGVPARVQSALPVQRVTEPFVMRKALKHLEKERVVIFAGGTGNPYFTTDTAAAIRAMEIGADVLLKATRVDGVYDKDPEVHGDALFFENISYDEVLERNLKVMDLTAITLCKEGNIPLVVFNIRNRGNLRKVVLGEPVGTTVRRER